MLYPFWLVNGYFDIPASTYQKVPKKTGLEDTHPRASVSYPFFQIGRFERKMKRTDKLWSSYCIYSTGNDVASSGVRRRRARGFFLACVCPATANKRHAGVATLEFLSRRNSYSISCWAISVGVFPIVVVCCCLFRAMLIGCLRGKQRAQEMTSRI